VNEKRLEVSEYGTGTSRIGPALAVLRERSRKSQAQLAAELGCSVGTVSRWERGERSPRGKWLLRVLGLYPDDETRALFGLSTPEAKPLQRPQRTNLQQPVIDKDADLARYFNDGMEGLNLLYEAAAAGVSGAREVLKAEAERLVRRGAQWRDAKYRKK